MEWCGMAWREMACTRQYGVVWSGLAWHVTAWHGMEGSNGMSWNGMARPMMAWDGLAAHRRAGVVVAAISEARMATKKKRSKSCRRVSTSETRRRGTQERRNAGTKERRMSSTGFELGTAALQPHAMTTILRATRTMKDRRKAKYIARPWKTAGPGASGAWGPDYSRVRWERSSRP